MALQVKPKIQKQALEHVDALILDIERIPGKARVKHRGLTIEGDWWDLGGWKHTIGRRIHPDDVIEWPRSICAAARFYGEKEIMFASEWDDGHEGFMRKTWEWYDRAHYVVGHNLQNFDSKHLKAGWAEYGWASPSPWQTVDTLKVARAEFAFESNTLDALCKRLGVQAKTDKYDPKIAQAAVDGDVKAQKKIRAYNCGDIKATESAYDRLRPWIKNHPHIGQFTGKEWSCPNCGFDGIANNPTGDAYTMVQRYRAFTCPKCNAHIRGNKKQQNPVQTRSYR